ncbi:MAG TPA: DUF6438 domain-containing protein [Gemmatimonadales bacterium]|nr:DUF6438 domain-containing protein [Gemmatimonadales bacterium]
MSRAALLLLALAAGCMPRPAGGGDEAATPAAATSAPDSTVVSLERAPCFGTCPVYRVTISRAGQVRFTGVRHTQQTGEASAQIAPARVDSLVAELREAGYFDFADAYEPGTDACGATATDLPSVTTSVVAGGRRKEIRHYYGCSAAPQELVRLERRIDEVAGTARWIGTR